MTKILWILLNCKDDTFAFFDEVFLFGSSLNVDTPNDVDILLVYAEDRLKQVKSEKAKVAKELAQKLGRYNFDFTVLNRSELQQTSFLMKVQHRKIKG